MNYRRLNANTCTCIVAAILFSGHPYISIIYYAVRYAQERVKRLSPSIYLFVCVCRQKTGLFAVLSRVHTRVGYDAHWHLSETVHC